MRTFELPDNRSLEILIGEANAWEAVMDLCKELKLPNYGGSGLDYVLTNIRQLNEYKKSYDKLVRDLNAVIYGEENLSRDDYHHSQHMEPSIDE